MVEIGTRSGKGMTAVLTDMNQPLGCAAGNAVEVRETVDALQGRGPADLIEVTLRLGAHMLMLGHAATDIDEATSILQAQLDSGNAFEKLKEMVEHHGGDCRVLDDTSRLPSAAIQTEHLSPEAGHLSAVDAERIGRACLVLGAGRARVTDDVDHAVGVTALKKVGEHVDRGEPLVTIRANDPDRLAEAKRLLDDAFVLSDTPVTPPPLIVETIGPGPV
jgi:thymidine phosphorylase